MFLLGKFAHFLTGTEYSHPNRKQPITKSWNFYGLDIFFVLFMTVTKTLFQSKICFDLIMQPDLNSFSFSIMVGLLKKNICQQ